MSATHINFDRSFFAIIVPGDDGGFFQSKEEARDFYESCFSGRDENRRDEGGWQARMNTGIAVHEWNPVENWARDVTSDFADWGNEDDEDADFAAYRRHKQYERAMRTW